MLLHQLHDMLPGTSIAWVHEETRQRYAEIAQSLEAIIATSQQALAGAGDLDLIFNGSPYRRDGVPSYGAATIDRSAPRVIAAPRTQGGWVLTNALVRAEIDADGLLVSVHDTATGREAIPAGQAGNLLQVHPDFPNMWDAWDIDAFYRNTVSDLRTADLVEAVDGEHGAVVRVTRTFGSSSIVQSLTLARDAARVDIETSVDWHEQEKLLKAAFPVDVHTDSAAFETQFGHIVRPTHENTSWDAARFEVCAHRWVHVGESGYGAALVNDSTYGHEVTRHEKPEGGSFSTVRLSLLRGPKFPDPRADQGTHHFRYSLVIGADVGDAVENGYALNLPERHVRGGHVVEPLVRAQGRVVLETIKLADDRGGDIVLRLYEPAGARASAVLDLATVVQDVWETNLLEQPLDGTALRDREGQRVRVDLRPFQIVTLRLRRTP
jgi:alpha-mannosidase